uniref:Uncharacterized protein n=1 Tax=Oryza meridionalis TaxID=40149 RepID=A0A0E0E7Z2_9ORYZ
METDEPATKAAGELEEDEEEESSGGGGTEPEVSATPAVVVSSLSHMFTGEEKETVGERGILGQKEPIKGCIKQREAKELVKVKGQKEPIKGCIKQREAKELVKVKWIHLAPVKSRGDLDALRGPLLASIREMGDHCNSPANDDSL